MEGVEGGTQGAAGVQGVGDVQGGEGVEKNVGR